MKKHLHGKRHSIARRSVAIGRDKKRIKKLNRWFAMMERFDWAGLALFRRAVDLGVERPAEIEVCGALDGRMLSMRWRCSVSGCGCIEEWHPAPDVVEFVAATYLAE